MTHKDIYTKFLIEYDKANVTSSYPSLTEYEIATVLDKAYNALIAQKVTGNNARRVGFEMDAKAISDLAPLVIHKHVKFFDDSHIPAVNIAPFKLPSDFNYFVQAYIDYNTYDKGLPYDGKTLRLLPLKLVPHYIAEKFFATSYNIPWIKIPVCYIEQDTVYVVYDLTNKPIVNDGSRVHLTYIKQPNTFVKNLSLYTGVSGASFFDCPNDASDDVKASYDFECSSTVAEELVSLAVAFALENVESQRLNSKLNMRGLEA